MLNRIIQSYMGIGICVCVYRLYPFYIIFFFCCKDSIYLKRHKFCFSFFERRSKIVINMAETELYTEMTNKWNLNSSVVMPKHLLKKCLLSMVSILLSPFFYQRYSKVHREIKGERWVTKGVFTHHNFFVL